MLLIVDDEPKLVELLSRYLGRLGYQVETCGDARMRSFYSKLDRTDSPWPLLIFRFPQ
jgi:DNA-binding response OmpR family regulator